jgi:hypothetical protein
MSSQQTETDTLVYLACQCVKMSEGELRELASGPDPIWREPAQKELERRASPAWRSILGHSLAP